MSYLDDFTTFTEVDPTSKVTITATQIDSQADSPTATYVYKDYGVGKFTTDIEHQFTLRPYNAQSTGSYVSVWALSNEIGNIAGVQEEIGLRVTYYALGPIYKALLFYRVDGGSIVSSGSSLDFSYDETRYITIIRSGGTLTAKQYGNSARTSLIKTITLNGVPTTTYRYVYGYQNSGGGTYHKVIVQIRNLTYDIDPNTVYKISGTKSADARIIVINESDYSIESNTVVAGSGAYEIETIDTTPKTIIARDNNGWVEVYGGVIPIEY
jgi:hypothetical protein